MDDFENQLLPYVKLFDVYIDLLAVAVVNYNNNPTSVEYGAWLAKRLDSLYEDGYGRVFMNHFNKWKGVFK